MTQRPYLNLGCGNIILPAPKPAHYMLLPDGLTEYALWHNVDRNAAPGVDEVVDIFRYPFPWADNSFDGALCSHIVEHIPHEIRLSEEPYEPSAAEIEEYRSRMDSMFTTMKRDDPHRSFETAHLRHGISARARRLSTLQDGWYAFFAELYRVLTPGSVVHVLSPYAWSQGAMSDPSHTRYITDGTFVHSMQPDQHGSFSYATGGINFELVQPVSFAVNEVNAHLLQFRDRLAHSLYTQLNTATDIYAQLRAIK